MSKHYVNFYTEKSLDPIVSIDFPADASSEVRQATKNGAKEAIVQMLAHLGVESEIRYIYNIDPMTLEEVDTEVEPAHTQEAAGVALPSADEVLAQEL
jgi:hypothetical protein